MIRWLFLIFILVAVIYYLFPIITICGCSMFPTYIDGEIIFATRLYRKSKLKAGDVVVYYAPNEKRRIVIKRIAEIDTNVGVMYCLGDNADESCDSRVYGYVSLNRLICKPITQRKQKVR